ncbi:MAG: SGNH/GDSL hydrolase family protein [Verrucomicrobiaceae bacterium]|nr:SGNH/GDSL hydrolase family protein [Verrucomicrobiaceae bacterium]
MKPTTTFVFSAILLLAARLVCAGELQLTLPPVVYATPDVAVSIYHDNIILTEKPEDYRFEFACKLGSNEARRWTVTPTDRDAGDHPLEVTVKDAGGKVLERGKTTLRVSPRNAGESKSLRILILGDSLTHGTIYPNEIASLLSRPGNPKWTMLGTHKPASAKPGVAHEGYGGWKWADFLTKFDPKPANDTAGPPARKTTSPFLFADAAQKPVFDLPRYFREHCDSKPPDVVTFLLGINDCFSANPADPDPKIIEVLANAEKLLAEFRKAAPKAILAVGLTTPPNSRQAAFEANYKDKYTRWGWKRIQHRLVQRMLTQLSGLESENIHLVPTQLNLDPIDGYPPNNGVHPNAVGYAQIGASFYSWLKSRL